MIYRLVHIRILKATYSIRGGMPMCEHQLILFEGTHMYKSKVHDEDEMITLKTPNQTFMASFYEVFKVEEIATYNVPNDDKNIDIQEVMTSDYKALLEHSDQTIDLIDGLVKLKVLGGTVNES